MIEELILEKKTGSISYIHLTYPENLSNIYKYGLKKSSGEDTNFGIDVIYVADKSDLMSIEALAQLSGDFTYGAEDDDFLIIHGDYIGEYLKCIGADENAVFGYNIGFVGLLNEKNSKVLKHDMVKGVDVKKYILNQWNMEK